MRVTTLAIILFIGLAVLYIFWIQPAWFWDTVHTVHLRTKGYTPAASAQEAADKFAKAIRERDYSAAALYVTRDYASMLEKHRKAAYAVGYEIDRVNNLMEEHGLATDKARTVLFFLDPFPSSVKMKEVLATKGQKQAVAILEFPPILKDNPLGVPPAEFAGLDASMFQCALVSLPTIYEVVAESDGGTQVYKLKINVTVAHQQRIDRFASAHKSYLTALRATVEEMRNGRNADKNKVARELVEAMKAAK